MQTPISDILIPKGCPTDIPTEIKVEIDKINWTEFKTAYGNAGNTIPLYLKNLFCSDMKIVMEATHQLWCSLCHQHAYISSAALPSYDILRIALLKLGDKVKIELLDIFQGFSTCTTNKYYGQNKLLPDSWEQVLRRKLMTDVDLFKDLARHTNKQISAFASRVVEDLVNDE